MTFHSLDEQRRRAGEAASFLRTKIPEPPQCLLVTGSGLDDLAQGVTGTRVIPYSEIPHFIPPSIGKHGGNLVAGSLNGLRMAVLQGRFHYYQGFSAMEVAFPVRVLGLLGARLMIVTNCAGGINPAFNKGAIMIIRDHIGFIPDNPLRGPNREEWGPRFPDMSAPYDKELALLALQSALRLELEGRICSGVYAAMPGPSLETPAETRFLGIVGADAVGMSTVPEVIMARHMGMRVVGLSVIANVNDPENFKPVLVQEVLQAMAETGADMARLLAEICRRLTKLDGMKVEK